ncbi:MAG: acyl carrier protein [Candidatus Glassbacteria bacterium]|nr:acyl carrier protein [Candidatus Glassbacteria bacterium]
MSVEEIFNTLKRILKTNGCRMGNLSMDTRLEELVMNSLELTAALLEIEDHFQVLVPDETWESWQMLAEVVEYVAEYKQTQEVLNIVSPVEEQQTHEPQPPEQAQE